MVQNLNQFRYCLYFLSRPCLVACTLNIVTIAKERCKSKLIFTIVNDTKDRILRSQGLSYNRNMFKAQTTGVNFIRLFYMCN